MKYWNATKVQKAGKYSCFSGIILMITLFSVGKLQAQGPCDQISFSKEDYGPCEFGMSYTTQTECYIELRFILTSGEFATYSVNSGDGFMVQQISPSELWVTHAFGFIPTGFHIPLFFTLPYDLNTSMSVAYLNDCAQLGCEIIGGWPIQSCPDPQDASIIGVKYRECESLPYSNQPLLEGWTIQAIDVLGNIAGESVTGADGTYAIYDLPKGQYLCREALQPGWTPKVPASGEYLIDLAASQQVIRNFGNCPTCLEDDLYMDVVQLPGNNDTCSYAMNLSNVGAYCFNVIDVTLASGTFASVTPSTGWQVMVIDSQHIQVKPEQGYIALGSYEPCKYRITGASTHDMTLVACCGSATNPTANRVFSCPILPSPPPCCPMGSTFGPELVCNPDFSLGNQCFTNDYNYFAPGGSTAIGSYSVLNFGQVYTANNQWSCIDHSTYASAGQMLVVDGFGGPVAWQQTVSVTAGTTYSFYAWFNNLVRPPKNYDDPQMALFVDNTQVAISSVIAETPDQWIRLCGAWTATSSGTVTLSIRMLATTSIGNDVGIDDISFRSCIPPPACQTSIQITQNADCTVTVCAVTTGPQPVSYQWCDGRTDACFTTAQIPCVPTTYCVTATCADGTPSSATSTFTVTDVTPPVAVCNPGVGVDLDANCNYQVTPSFVDGGSSDNCQIQSMSVSPNVLTGCGDHTVTLTVTDFCGNTSSCTMGIQTIEVITPTMTCPPNTTVHGFLDAAGFCIALYNPVLPVAIDQCDASVSLLSSIAAGAILQEGTNIITWIGTDDCGNQASCTVSVHVTCDTCKCGSFSNLFARPTVGAPSIALMCGGSYQFPCPAPGQSIPITGKFACEGDSCPSSTQVNWTLIDPQGTATNGSVSAGPYFFLPIMPLQYAIPGTYTLVLQGNCGGVDCPPCIIKFTVDCPNPCPCDVLQFQKDVNKGFATALWPTSCKGCFSPIALNDCDMVEWKINGGATVANTNGNQSFCHTFPGAGTYTVTMVVTRKKSDGSLCEVFVYSQSVSVTCIIKSPCDESVFANPGFSQMAVPGGLNSGGASMKWKGLYGDPTVQEGLPAGTEDEWSMLLSGHIDAADVLSAEFSVCAKKEGGTVQLKGKIEHWGDPHENLGRDKRIAIFFNRGDSYVFNVFNAESCYRVAMLDVTAYDETDWFDLEIPYDLSQWGALDTCGGNVVAIKPIVYVYTCFEASQGPETGNRIALDHFCVDQSLVAVDDPFKEHALRIAPNPTTTSFTVTLPTPARPGMRLRITDPAGRLVQELETNAGATQQIVQAEHLPNGLYFLQLTDHNQIIAVEKLVKQ